MVEVRYEFFGILVNWIKSWCKLDFIDKLILKLLLCVFKEC